MLKWFKSEKQVKTLGQQGEEFAQGEYKKRGYKILAANFFNKKGKRLGEIDFIAVNDESVIFVEVKTRYAVSGRFGSGAEAVDRFKQVKLLKAVRLFLVQFPKYSTLRPQIDVCIVNSNGSDSVRSKKLRALATPLGRLTSNGVDSPPFSATIIPNAVEDFS